MRYSISLHARGSRVLVPAGYVIADSEEAAASKLGLAVLRNPTAGELRTYCIPNKNVEVLLLDDHDEINCLKQLKRLAHAMGMV